MPVRDTVNTEHSYTKPYSSSHVCINIHPRMGVYMTVLLQNYDIHVHVCCVVRVCGRIVMDFGFKMSGQESLSPMH